MKLKILNFQKHKELVIELDPKITTIVGPSDSGKSAVIRAIKWLMTNQPRGLEFIKHGSKFTTVMIEDIDGHSILRQRGKDINLYTLDNQEFKAFGNDVPPDIAKIFNINYLNFQSQHDSPFWFSDTAGEVSRQLNQIVDLSKIDTTLSNIDRIHRKRKAELEVIKERKEAIRKEGRELIWVKEADKDLQRVEKLEKQYNTIVKEHIVLQDLVTVIQQHAKSIKTADTCKIFAEQALKLGTAWANKLSIMNKLLKSIEQIEELNKKADMPIPPSLSSLEETSQKIQRLQKNKRDLQILIDNIKEGELVICQKQENLLREQKELKKKLGSICPLCGNEIKS